MSAAARHVVLFGGSDCRPGEVTWVVAESFGRAVAESGWTLVSGGYGGVMEAAGAGARSAGGESIGVLCDLFGGSGNPHLSREIHTPDLHARLGKLIELGDAYVVLPGSTGTLVELAMVWELMNKSLLETRPLICLGPFWEPVVSLFDGDSTSDERIETAGLPPTKRELVTFAASVELAIEHLRSQWPS